MIVISGYPFISTLKEAHHIEALSGFYKYILIARGVCVDNIAHGDVWVAVARFGIHFAGFDDDGFMGARMCTCEAELTLAFAGSDFAID